MLTVGASGTATLIATGGSIDETGTLIAGTLSGRATGAATFVGASATANEIGTIGSFTASGFTLRDGIGLSLNGLLNGGSLVSIIDAGPLSIGGTVSAMAVSLGGASLDISGLVTDGGSGTVGLFATSGSISETGTLVAGTLSGSSTGLTTLTGSSLDTNQIATLGSFNAAGFTLNDGIALTVAGPLDGGTNATITDLGLLTISGSLGAGAVALSGTAIAISGLVTDHGLGTVDLIATDGTINETGTLIAGTLSGNSAGATTLTGATAGANQVAAIASFTASGFTLNDGTSLTVAGALNGGTAVTIADSAVLTVGGLITAAAVSLTGASIVITGTVTDGGAGTVGLIATGGTIDETGTLIAGTLTGNATGATSLTGVTSSNAPVMVANTGSTLPGATTSSNQVTTLGSFTAAGFNLNDGIGLSIAGIVNGGTAATITANGLLTIGGTVIATAVNLAGTSVSLAGLVTDGGAGTTYLLATGGTIAEAGTILAGTLSGGSTGTTTLTGAAPTANQIAVLGDFSAAGLTLNDGTSLLVSGLVNGGTAAAILDSALLTIGGTVTAAAVNLTAANLAIAGLVSDGGAGTTMLVASGGTIDESGTLVSGALSGASSGAALLTGAATATNQVASFGGFTAAGFTLDDGISLTVAGLLNGGTAATIADSMRLTIGGTVTAAAIGLSGASLAIPGLVTDGGAGTVGLFATAGAIDEIGTVIAGTLSGNSTGATTLAGANGAANQIATLGDFTATNFMLNDGRSLTVAGALNGGASATIADLASLTIAGAVSAAAVSLTSANLAIPGLVTDGGSGTTTLTATSGTIVESGTLIAGTLSGSSSGATTLTDAAAITNEVATIATFSAAGFTLNDNTNLTVAGVLNGGISATIVESSLLTVGGSVIATAISLTAANVAIPGMVSDGGAGVPALSPPPARSPKPER